MKGFLKYAAFLFVIYHLTANVNIFNIEGESMQPTLFNGDKVLVQTNCDVEVGDIVIIEFQEEYLIKRITSIKDDSIYIEGDNQDNSFDSNDFGWINISQVYGKVIIPLT